MRRPAIHQGPYRALDYGFSEWHSTDIGALFFLYIDRFQGRSLLGLLRNDREYEPREDIHYEFDYRGRRWAGENPDPDLHILWVVRDRESKYIYFADPEFPPILFDLRSDPDELNNVAGLAEYAAIELSCCHKLLRWRMYNEDQRMEHWAQPLREADLLLVQRSADGRTTCAADNTAADYADIELQHSVPTLGFVTW